jgi:hypothetical protein
LGLLNIFRLYLFGSREFLVGLSEYVCSPDPSEFWIGPSEYVCSAQVNMFVGPSEFLFGPSEYVCLAQVNMFVRS